MLTISNQAWSAVPAASSPISPDNGAFGGATPTYTFTEVTDSTWYQLWVQDSNGVQINQWYRTSESSCANRICAITPTTGVSGQTVAWWVRTWNTDGLGPWSARGRFSAVEVDSVPVATSLILPVNGADAGANPTYTFAEIANSTWYQLWVQDRNGVQVNQWYRTSESSCANRICSITPTTGVSGQTVEWWVRTWNTAGFGPWSAKGSFSASQPRSVTIAPIGDSITNGGNSRPSYRRALWQKLQQGGYDVDFIGSKTSFFGNSPPVAEQDFDLDHEGHWAKEAGYVADNIDTWLTGYTPDIVIMHLGTNDFDRGQSNSSTLAEFERIITSLRADNPLVTILMAEIIPMRNKDTASLNSAIRNWAPAQSTILSPVIVVDQYTGYKTDTDSYDNYHPNAVGEEKMANRWFDALQTILDSEDFTSLLAQ